MNERKEMCETSSQTFEESLQMSEESLQMSEANPQMSEAGPQMIVQEREVKEKKVKEKKVKEKKVKEKKVKEQREYKDTVFRLLFSNRKRALALYNGINGTDYQDESLLEFNTLENAIYMNLYNDISFVIVN